jgi:trimethylamine--corrinoid protein Co-methyltransferase
VAEFIARNRRLLAEIEVSDETLAVDVLKAVGPGGAFLGQRHTRRHLRGNQWRSRILNRASYDRWLEDGGTDATEKARQRASELLATHEAEPLPEGLAERLDAVVPAG